MTVPKQLNIDSEDIRTVCCDGEDEGCSISIVACVLEYLSQARKVYT